MSEVIVVDSSDDEANSKENNQKRPSTRVSSRPASNKRPAADPSPAPRKRITPVTLSREVTITKTPKESSSSEHTRLIEAGTRGDDYIFLNKVNENFTVERFEEDALADDSRRDETSITSEIKTDGDSALPKSEPKKLTEDFANMIAACREADPSPDMERLISNKLLKLYRSAPTDFTHSKNFRLQVRQTTEGIRNEPSLVFLKLQPIVDEMKIRKDCVDGSLGSTSDKPESKLDKRLKGLNTALEKCVQKIKELENAEVNFDDESNSTWFQVGKFQKRAKAIYQKICQLTGEDEHANRVVKKRIKFHETNLQEFNKAVQTFVNKSKNVPDFLDILKIMQHCNKKFVYNLRKDEEKLYAQEAFLSVGRLLQKRRKLDLYEMVDHFVSNQRDPAEDDADLRAKLEKNKKLNDERMNQIIKEYAEKDAGLGLEEEEEGDDGQRSSANGMAPGDLTNAIQNNQKTSSSAVQTKSDVSRASSSATLVDFSV